MKKTRSPASRITVAHGANDVDIAIDGRTVVTAPDLSGLIASAHGLGDADPLRIHRVTSLSIELSPSEKRTLLAEIRVDEKEANLLEGRRQKLLENHLVWETPPIRRGIAVDGKPWGWFYASPEGDEECWQLIPTRRSSVVLQAGASFEGDSMVGGFMDVGIRRYGEATAITWHYQEDDPANCDVSYEVDYWDELCIECLSTIFEEPLCPLGSEADDWLVHIDADPMFSTDTIGKAMAGIWLPCEEHLRSGKPLIVRNIAGSDWEWESNSWAPLPST
jgi:hypothetical protein